LTVHAAHGVTCQRAGAGEKDARAQEQRAARGRRGRLAKRDDGGDRDERHRDAGEAGGADGGTEQRRHRPARVVDDQRLRQRGELSGLREDHHERADCGERQRALEGASGALRRLAAQHDQREDRAAERNRVADEPGRSQPQEHERDHDWPQ
jgi:hypothetical protein